jgi:hypothetical protein
MILCDQSTGIIYSISFPNGKKYIGQTKRNFEQRMREHQRDDSNCVKLKNALKKFPDDQVYANILKKDIPIDYLDFWENFFIDKFNSIKNGYNIKKNDNPKVPIDEVILPEINIEPKPKKINPFEKFMNPDFISKKVNKLLPKIVEKPKDSSVYKDFPIMKISKY